MRLLKLLARILGGQTVRSKISILSLTVTNISKDCKFKSTLPAKNSRKSFQRRTQNCHCSFLKTMRRALMGLILGKIESFGDKSSKFIDNLESLKFI